MEVTRAAVREIEGLDVLDERFVGRPGVFDYDPLRLAIDVRGLDVTGYELATMLRESGRRQPRARRGERDRRRVRDGRARARDGRAPGGRVACGRRPAGRARRRLIARLGRRLRAAAAVGRARDGPARGVLRAPRRWCRSSEAVGRIATESLAAYPPGIPNVLPGERLTAETLDYIHQTLELGGSLRGASDRRLRTLRVVVE